MQKMHTNLEQILNRLTVIDKKVGDPLVLNGYEAVVNGLNNYVMEKKMTTRNCPEWSIYNTYLILISKENCKVAAIRDYGKYQPKPSDIFMKTDYIPLELHHTVNEVELRRKVMRIIDLYSRFKKKVFDTDAKPLVITGNYGKTDYIARSLVEEKDFLIHNYHLDDDDVFISSVDDHSKPEKLNKFIYSVCFPTFELIKELGLDLDLIKINFKVS